MSLGRTNFDAISEADLSDLIQAGVSEGLVIDYKRDPYGKSDSDKKEALKDITSFANSAGGHLIVGMEETKGIATGFAGLHVDADSLINRLESLVRDGVEPRIVGIRMKAVHLSGGGVAIVIRIPRSWNPPHRVSVAKTNRFHVRNSGGAHEASVEELRVLFTLAADAQGRIRSFRSDRLAMLSRGQGPVLVASADRLIMHLIPLSAFGMTTQIDLESAYEIRHKFKPRQSHGMSPRFNLDGLLNIWNDDKCLGYVQIFRNGIIEAVRSDILNTRRPNPMWPATRTPLSEIVCNVTEITGHIVDLLPEYFEGMKALDVVPPIILSVSLQGVEGAELELYGHEHRFHALEAFPHADPLLLPEAIVDDYALPQDYLRSLRPIFDALWNAAGLAKCTYYDSDDNWRVRSILWPAQIAHCTSSGHRRFAPRRVPVVVQQVSETIGAPGRERVYPVRLAMGAE